MKKFLAFCQRPLAIISSLILAIGILLIVVASTTPLSSRVYVYEKTEDDTMISMKVTFGSDTLEVSWLVYAQGKGYMDNVSLPCHIEDNGFIFVTSQNGGSVTKFGELHGYKILTHSETDDDPPVSTDITLVCKSVKNVTIWSIVFTVVGALLLAAAITLIILVKKGVIKFKEKTKNVDEQLLEKNTTE